MLAVRSEHPNVVDLLCKRGSDMHTHGFDNVDPIEYAINKRNLYLSDVLMKHERQISSQMSSTSSSSTEHSNNSSVQLSLTAATPHALIKQSAVKEDFNSNSSLTGLLQQKQEEHLRQEQENNSTANDSMFLSD